MTDGTRFGQFMPLLPLVIYLVAWTGLTALGATITLFDWGQEHLRLFLGNIPQNVSEEIGTSSYYLLLLMPYVVVPAFFFAAYGISKKYISIIQCEFAKVSSGALMVVAVSAITFCLWKLNSIDTLYPGLLVYDLTYDQYILKRTEIINSAGFIFYGLVYAVIPMSSVLFFSRMIYHRCSIFDISGLVLTFAATLYFTVAIYMKLPIIVYFMLIAFSVLLSGRKLFLFPVIVVMAVATLLSLHVVMGGYRVGEPPATEQQEKLSGAGGRLTGAADQDASGASRGQVVPAGPKPSDFSIPARLLGGAWSITESIAFRMGAAFPYYVAIFRDPSERCGIETNSLPLLPTPRCVLPRKVFDAMYPNVTWVEGFAPAAAHVSAYGERGLSYALFVLAMIGIILGVMSGMMRFCSGPVFVGLGVAVSIVAYYFTQVPFLGALSYSHGLVFFLIPLFLGVAIEKLRS